VSDFLDNLVARSLSRLETVRPQVISIFEPPPLNSGAIFHDGATPELPLVEREMENPIAERLGQMQSLWRSEPDQGAMAVDPLVARERAKAHIESQQILPVERQDRAAGEPMAITPHSRAETSPRVPTEPTPRAARQKPAAVAPVITEESPRSKLPNEYKNKQRSITAPEPEVASSVRTQVTPARAEEPSLPLPSKPIPSTPPPLASEQKHSDVPPGVIEKRVIETIARERHMEDEATVARATKASQLALAAIPRSPPAQQPKISSIAPIVPASVVVSPHVLRAPPNEGATKAPSVYITIGRVEVRATTPAPVRSRPQPAPAPVMSLTEYLRQRAAGERR
jgi:hypothetical protein